MNLKKAITGFTLIEMLVVIFITSILSTLVISNFRHAEQHKRVDLTADNIMGVLRHAQTLAISGGQVGSATCTNKSATAYNLALTINDGSADSFTSSSQACSPTQTFVLETQTTDSKVNVTARVQLASGPQTPTSNTANTITINFTPPFGAVTAKWKGQSPSETFISVKSVEIKVELPDHSYTKMVTVDGISGLISQ